MSIYSNVHVHITVTSEYNTNTNHTCMSKHAFSHPLAHHGVYTSSIPLILNGNASQPYRYIELTAEVIPERIVTSPQHIAVQPVPLGITVEAQFSVIMKDFTGSV